MCSGRKYGVIPMEVLTVCMGDVIGTNVDVLRGRFINNQVIKLRKPIHDVL